MEARVGGRGFDFVLQELMYFYDVKSVELSDGGKRIGRKAKEKSASA